MSYVLFYNYYKKFSWLLLLFAFCYQPFGRIDAADYGYQARLGISASHKSEYEVYRQGNLTSGLYAEIEEVLKPIVNTNFSFSAAGHYQNWGLGYQAQIIFVDDQGESLVNKEINTSFSQSKKNQIAFDQYQDHELFLAYRFVRLGDLPVFQWQLGSRFLYLNGFSELPVSIFKTIYWIGFQFEPQFGMFWKLEWSIPVWAKTGQDFSEFNDISDVFELGSKLFDIGIGLKIFMQPDGFFIQGDISFLHYGSASIRKDFTNAPQYNFAVNNGSGSFYIQDTRVMIRVGYFFTRPHYNQQG